jgi:hypothetical protein
VSDLAEESSDTTAIAALGQLTAHHSDARAMLLIGKTALVRGLAMDRYAFPDIGVPPYSTDRSSTRSLRRLFDRAHGERLRPARQVTGQGRRADAGHPESRARYREAFRRRLRLEWACVRPGLQHPDGRRRGRRVTQGVPRLLHYDVRRLQRWPRAGQAMGGAARAIRAIPRSTRSTGSSAFR